MKNKMTILVMILLILGLMGCESEDKIVSNEYDKGVINRSSKMATQMSNAQVANITFEDMGKKFKKYKKFIAPLVYTNNFDMKNPNLRYLYSYGVDSRFYPQKYERLYSTFGVQDNIGYFEIIHYYKVIYKLSKDSTADDLEVLSPEDTTIVMYITMDYTFDGEGKLVNYYSWQSYE